MSEDLSAKFARLPKWALDHFRDLVRQRDQYKRIAEDLPLGRAVEYPRGDDGDAPGIYINRGSTPESIMGVYQRLPEDRVRIVTKSGEFDVQLQEDGRLKVMASSRRADHIAVLPNCSNVIEIGLSD